MLVAHPRSSRNALTDYRLRPADQVAAHGAPVAAGLTRPAPATIRGVGPTLRIGSISESDLDLFLLKEIASSPGFLRWLLSHLRSDLPHTLLAAERSVESANGETDVLLTLGESAGRRVRVFIENKVGAGFQPDQLGRYRERSCGSVKTADCTEGFVMLIAPERYNGAADQVDAFVSYESIHSFIKSQPIDARRPYKLALLQAAIEKGRLGYNPETDAQVTLFWRSYWEMACLYGAELKMPAPGPKPAGSGFVHLRPPSLPRGLEICHKLADGCVDLHLSGQGARVPELVPLIEPILESGMGLQRAAKSAAIRIRVPVLDTTQPFEAQAAETRIGIDAAVRLLGWAKRHSRELAAAMQP